MANKNVTLKDNDGNSCFPKTFDFNVFNSSNQSLDNLLANIDATKMNVFSQGAYDVNTCYDAGIYLIANGLNCPSGSQYGSLLVMPYRKPTGNTKTDYCVQIYVPNGDDSTEPNSMFYRTSLGDSWNAWQKVSCIHSVSVAGSDGFVRYSNGIQLVWGRTYGYNITVNYAAPFKDSSSYSCSGVSAGWTGSYGNYGMSNLKANSFYLNADKNATWLYLAIGFWK